MRAAAHEHHYMPASSVMRTWNAPGQSAASMASEVLLQAVQLH